MAAVPLPVEGIGNLKTSAEVATKSDENLMRRKRRCRGYPSNCGIKDEPLDLRTPALPLQKFKIEVIDLSDDEIKLEPGSIVEPVYNKTNKRMCRGYPSTIKPEGNF